MTRYNAVVAVIAALIFSVAVHAQDTVNLLFVGNSITAGATLKDPSAQAPPVVCGTLVEQATGLTVNVYNGGHSGITTFGFLPGRDDFSRLVTAARAFRNQNGGRIYFSIMLGTNDSACTVTEGAPVSPETYGRNLRIIIDSLIHAVPSCRILLNYPIWYSPNTHNRACYMQEGLDRLRSYYPVIRRIARHYPQVYAGSRQAWDSFQGNSELFTSEQGRFGVFHLHPNAAGAERLAHLWAGSLLRLLRKDGIKARRPLPPLDRGGKL